MLVNQRIKEIREYRRLESRKLAEKAGLSAAEISHIERNLRTPKMDTLQKIGAALDVTIGFLVGEDEDADLPLPRALACQSSKVFLRQTTVSSEVAAYIRRVRNRDSAPQTLRGWGDLVKNIEEFFASDPITVSKP